MRLFAGEQQHWMNVLPPNSPFSNLLSSGMFCLVFSSVIAPVPTALKNASTGDDISIKLHSCARTTAQELLVCWEQMIDLELKKLGCKKRKVDLPPYIFHLWFLFRYPGGIFIFLTQFIQLHSKVPNILSNDVQPCHFLSLNILVLVNRDHENLMLLYCFYNVRCGPYWHTLTVRAQNSFCALLSLIGESGQI